MQAKSLTLLNYSLNPKEIFYYYYYNYYYELVKKSLSKTGHIKSLSDTKE